MPTFIIHGDTTPLDGAETIETADALARSMFVTIEPGTAAGEILIRAVPPEALAEFDGLLYQIDRDDDRDAIVLRQVRMQFWPWATSHGSPD